MKSKKWIEIVAISSVVFTLSSSCKKEPEPTPLEPYSFQPSYLNENFMVETATIVSRTMADGSTADCYKVVFQSNPIADGPYCPATINDIGGLGIYDGATNPGFQVMKAALWNAMEADGYDVVDANGNINIIDPGAGMGGGPPAGGGSMAGCLEASPDNTLKLTYYIPIEPTMAASNDVIDIVEKLGVSIDGIPLTGHPPSATQGPPGIPNGGGGIPAIDPCGGHVDPAGYYHLHFGAEEMNNVLAAYNITEVSCSNFIQDESALIGFAKDGFPIYASKDSDGSAPTDLDECQGHTCATDEFPVGVYHYHVTSTTAPNLPTCLKGLIPQEPFTFE